MARVGVPRIGVRWLPSGEGVEQCQGAAQGGPNCIKNRIANVAQAHVTKAASAIREPVLLRCVAIWGMIRHEAGENASTSQDEDQDHGYNEAECEADDP
jgi:hypothetical protein